MTITFNRTNALRGKEFFTIKKLSIMKNLKKTGALIPVVIYKNDSENSAKPGTWDDDGGECDGWGYVSSKDDIEKEMLETLMDKGDVEINDHGVVITNYEPDENLNKNNIKGNWSGWSSTGIAYFENEDSADSFYLANQIAGRKYDDTVIEEGTGKTIYLYKVKGGYIEEYENNDLQFSDLPLKRIKEYYTTGE